MSWTTGYGFNFRGTVGYVADVGQEFFWRGGTQDTGAWTYPSTYSGVTAGWVGGLGSGIDVDNTRDRRLAGRVQRSNAAAGEADFRIDLPATGDYEIGLAFSSSITVTRVEVRDNASSLFTRSPSVSSGNVGDAAGTVFSFANWPSSQVLVPITMTSTQLIVRVGGGGGSHSTNLHHVFVRQASAGGNKFRPYFITG